MKKEKLLYLLALPALLLPSGCNESAEDVLPPDPATITQLTLSVTGEQVQQPFGNVYLFYSEACDLSLATVEGDGTRQPRVDVSRQYAPVIHWQGQTLHPVSPYGTVAGGSLDTSSSVRYSQVTFDIASLSTAYGTVKKNSTVLVVIILNHEATRSWTFHALQLRRNHLIRIMLPDHREPTYVNEADLNAKWWQEI